MNYDTAEVSIKAPNLDVPSGARSADPVIDVFAKRLFDARSHLKAGNDWLSEISDRLLGGAVDTSISEQPEQAYSGSIGEVDRAIIMISDEIAAIHRTIKRLSQL